MADLIVTRADGRTVAVVVTRDVAARIAGALHGKPGVQLVTVNYRDPS